MKKSIIAFILGVLAMNAHAQPNLDEEHIKLQLQSMGTLADQSAFDYLVNVFSEEVYIDYTSAFGGEPSVVKRDDLMRSWAGLLPGFDLTRHELSNLQVKINGNGATAHADITANHFLGNGFWQISGRYEYELEKANTDWSIRSLTLIAESEKGSRDVLGAASKRVADLIDQNNQ